jgi:hypothetical protein
MKYTAVILFYIFSIVLVKGHGLEALAPTSIIFPIVSDDASKAACDGPHVFYQKKKIVIKAVVPKDSTVIANTDTYVNRADVPLLTCQLPESGEKFSFKLRDSLPIPPDEYDLPAKMLVVSDMEGNFQGFKLLLQGLNVIDTTFKWSFGKGHLVLIGDFFDRGLNVTEVLWLIYKLEEEALVAGGRVHFILGNHEILNLQGYTQYVRNKYLMNADLIGESYPSWYSNDTELGRWLRSKNAIEKIGDNIFCHGGISQQMVESGFSLRKVNEISRAYLGVPYEEINDKEAKIVFDTKTGIFWYRGIAKKLVQPDDVTKALAWAGGKRLIVGHTLVEDVTALYNGRVFCIDLYHEEFLRQGLMKSLWIEEGAFYGINSKGEKSSIFSVSFSKS